MNINHLAESQAKAQGVLTPLSHHSSIVCGVFSVVSFFFSYRRYWRF